MTNTKIKFVIVLESLNTNLRDNEIRTVSEREENTDILVSFPS